jgi:hypothetical protein
LLTSSSKESNKNEAYYTRTIDKKEEIKNNKRSQADNYPLRQDLRK